MKAPLSAGKVVSLAAAEARRDDDLVRRRVGDRLLVRPQPIEQDVEPPFLRPDRRARHRRLRRGPVWDSMRLARWSAALVLGVALLWAGAARIMASDRLKVSKVDVRGGRFLSEGEVRELLGPAVGQNILTLDIEALKARLRASPWVADATVVRSLPDTLRVIVTERHPVALAEVGGLYLMDSEGELVDLHGARTAAFDLPIVRGLAELDPAERRARTRAAGALLDELGELAAVVSEVVPEAGGDVRLVLSGTADVVLLPPPPSRERLLSFLALREQVVSRVPVAEYWDLRFRDRIYARPAAPAPPPPRPAAPADVAPAVEPVPTVPLIPDGGARVLPAAPSLPPAVAVPVSVPVPSAGGGR